MTTGTGDRLLPARRFGAMIAERLDNAAALRRREQDALLVMAAEFRRLREEEQVLLRRQAESLEVVAAAVTKLTEGRDRAVEPARDDGELAALRERYGRLETELDAARAEANESARRLATANARLRRAREELAAATPWWRRRRAAAPLA